MVAGHADVQVDAERNAAAGLDPLGCRSRPPHREDRGYSGAAQAWPRRRTSAHSVSVGRRPSRFSTTAFR